MSSISPSLSRSSSRENIQHPPQTKETPGVSLPAQKAKKKNEDTVIKMPKFSRREQSSGEERSSSSSSSTGAVVPKITKITKKVAKEIIENQNNSQKTDTPDELSAPEHPENIPAPVDFNFKEQCRNNKIIVGSFLSTISFTCASFIDYKSLFPSPQLDDIDGFTELVKDAFDACLEWAFYGYEDLFKDYNLSPNDLRQCAIDFLEQETSNLLRNYNLSEIVPPDRPLPLSVGKIPENLRFVMDDFCSAAINKTSEQIAILCSRYDYPNARCAPFSCGVKEQYSAPFPPGLPAPSTTPDQILGYCLNALAVLSGLLLLASFSLCIFKTYQKKD